MSTLSDPQSLFGHHWHGLGLVPQAENVCDQLLARYSEPQRHYHNVAHIVACLNELAANPFSDSARRHDLALALFFHDAVYDAHRSDNEQASAALAQSQLAGIVSPAALQNIARLIQATDHRIAPTKLDEQWIVDIDLSIIGQAKPIFAAYDRAIRLEYAHVPDLQYRAGRAAVLQNFLSRARIYQTPALQTSMNPPLARICRKRFPGCCNIRQKKENPRHESRGLFQNLS